MKGYVKKFQQKANVPSNLVGRGQYGHVIMDIEPLPRGGGFVFETQIKGGTVPSTYFPAIEMGIREALTEGPSGQEACF